MLIQYKNILATIGLVIVCLTAFVHLNVYRSEYYEFKGSSSYPEAYINKSFEVGGTSGRLGDIDQYLTDKVGKLPIIKIELYYPDVMFYGEPSKVIIKYNALFSEDFDNDGNVKEPKISSRPLSIKLSSSDFSIASEQQLDQESGMKVPAKLSWKISPDKLRKRFITIDFSKLLDTKELRENATINFTDNFEKKPLNPSKPYVITVAVKKYFPFPKNILALLESISTILGLVLMIIDLMKWLNRKRTAPS